ncbi:PREDICTED: protein-glutamate O-methyltransferase-like isoform X2 [Papilio xuthus]|uniref:Damage-control phosphatase ARMT1 n=1 Tax=Papilio xuthus TaxID=66420 RepID=A0AAJ7EIJ1_PAPXU|nr:PREDICTED: protein-glutamate O-methyltransferase-like isoform X2 [Papilio xuthus]
MSQQKVGSRAPSKTSVASDKNVIDEDESTKPEFIYGGPFIKVEKPSPFINTSTPINLPLQGTFKKSFAYYSLRDRLPVILTKVIDYLSREGSKIRSAHNASDDDIRGLIQYVTKLKNDLVTNKKYDLFTVDTPEAKRWNHWIESCDSQHYFTNTWVFTECYVYRRLREGCELSKGLKNFDPFDEQKLKAFQNSLEPMCVVADKLVTMLPPSDKDKRKADFTTLLKICLWANKCDLSLSMGEQVSLKSADGKARSASVASLSILDPFKMVLDLKDKVLVDDSSKICDQVIAKTEAMAKAIAANTTFKFQCSCHRLATQFGIPRCPDKEADPAAKSEAKSEAKLEVKSEAAPEAEGEVTEEPPKIPCPAKMVLPEVVTFDIVCDNSGYELFSDLCFAHFLISQEIVKKVRFHVKKIPWFVSDVTPVDFKKTLEMCANANYSREVPQEAPPESGEGGGATDPPPPLTVSADNLRQLGSQWMQFFEDGTFVVMCDEFWTSPIMYKEMKTQAFQLYRKLQLTAAILFKGDLNYRKLLAERNCPPTLSFEQALQGFNPAPIIALRTVKADLICGLPKGKFEQLNKIDEKWMEKGDYGVIQYGGKVEPLKSSDRPCPDYGEECRGVICPAHPTDIVT